jgi:alanine-synthesizing transaminase
MTDIPGISCVKPKGALYLFPKIDLKKFDFNSDEDFAYRLLEEKHVLIVPGTGFNHRDHAHFRIVFLPQLDELEYAARLMRNFLDSSRVISATNAIEV